MDDLNLHGIADRITTALCSYVNQNILKQKKKYY